MYRDNIECSGGSEPFTSLADIQQAHEAITKLHPMLMALAAKLSRGSEQDQADYFQDGACAVLTAVSRFDSAKGSILHYAARCARGCLLNRRRSAFRRKRELSIGVFDESDWNDPNTAPAIDRDVLNDNEVAERALMAIDCRLISHVAAQVLTPKEFHAFELVHLDGYQPSEAAAKMRVSAPRITQLVASAVTKIRTALTDGNGMICAPVTGPTASAKQKLWSGLNSGSNTSQE